MMAGSAPVPIGIAGLGTVGAGTFRLLRQHAELLAARTGRNLAITAVSARDAGSAAMARPSAVATPAAVFRPRSSPTI